MLLFNIIMALGNGPLSVLAYTGHHASTVCCFRVHLKYNLTCYITRTHTRMHALTHALAHTFIFQMGKLWIRYNTSTSYGSSGSPVIRVNENGEGSVIALHHKSVQEANDRKSENQGVLLSAILDDINSKCKGRFKLYAWNHQCPSTIRLEEVAKAMGKYDDCLSFQLGACKLILALRLPALTPDGAFLSRLPHAWSSSLPSSLSSWSAAAPVATNAHPFFAHNTVSVATSGILTAIGTAMKRFHNKPSLLASAKQAYARLVSFMVPLASHTMTLRSS